MLRAGLGIGAVMVMLLVAVGTAGAHPERNAFFPDGSVGSVPKVRGKADQVLTVCKTNSKKLIKRSFKGKQLTKKRKLRLRQLKACQLPPHPGRGERGPQRGDHPHHARRLQGGAEPPQPRARPALRQRLRRHRRRHPRLGRLRQEGRARRELRVPAQVPQRAEPDRDHRRLRRSRPRLRRQVQHPDPGHGPAPHRRADLRPADQAQRDPRRPRRRHPPAQLHRRVLGLQQHLHPRDQRLRDAPHQVDATRASTASSRSPPTTGSTTASRRSAPATRASTPARVPRATASATASRSATSTPTTTRSATPARPATACGCTTAACTTTPRA